jgi:two-component system, NarL family, sensor histidine kinase UhpB
MNLKLRINLIITLLLGLVMLLGMAMMIENARKDVRAEVESTTVLALHLLDAQMKHYTSERDWNNVAANNEPPIFRLQSLDNVRHLKIEFFDVWGRLRDSNRATTSPAAEAPPRWFAKLMSKVSLSLKPMHRPIIINSRVLGELVITPDPSYEIAEIWHDTFGLIGLGILFFILVNGLVYWAVSSALRPLTNIFNALTELEVGNLAARLPIFSLPELSQISHKFNAMAQTLQNSISNNHRLSQQLIRLQEDERKHLAHDLHDEIGQHLTAINIDAGAILKAKNLNSAHASAAAITQIATQMMEIVREMLHRLRPASLEEMGLRTALLELIDNWRERNRGVNTSITISDKLTEIHETVGITAYRVVQECLTNISKHADTRFVIIKVEAIQDEIKIFIEDHGRGFEQVNNTTGLGLAGMKERVEGLGGTFELTSEKGVGTKVNVRLPVKFRAN